MKPNKLSKDIKYEVFDKSENEIASYHSSLTDYGNIIKYSEICFPKISKIFSEFDNYVQIEKANLKLSFEQILYFLKNVSTENKKSKKDCLIEYLDKEGINYSAGLWDN